MNDVERKTGKRNGEHNKGQEEVAKAKMFKCTGSCPPKMGEWCGTKCPELFLVDVSGNYEKKPVSRINTGENKRLIEGWRKYDPAVNKAFQIMNSLNVSYEEMLEILVVFFKKDRDSLRDELLQMKINGPPPIIVKNSALFNFGVSVKALRVLKADLKEFIETRELDDDEELCKETEQLILRWVEIFFENKIFDDATARCPADKRIRLQNDTGNIVPETGKSSGKESLSCAHCGAGVSFKNLLGEVVFSCGRCRAETRFAVDSIDIDNQIERFRSRPEMRTIITFTKPISFGKVTTTQNLNLKNLKQVPYEIGKDKFPKLSPGEFCQSDDKKSVFCQAHEG